MLFRPLGFLTFWNLALRLLTFSLCDFPPFGFYLFDFSSFDFMSFDFLSWNPQKQRQRQSRPGLGWAGQGRAGQVRRTHVGELGGRRAVAVHVGGVCVGVGRGRARVAAGRGAAALTPRVLLCGEGHRQASRDRHDKLNCQQHVMRSSHSLQP